MISGDYHYDKVEHGIAKLKSFHWLSRHHGMMNNNPLYKYMYGKYTRKCLGRFSSYFSLIFHIFGH